MIETTIYGQYYLKQTFFFTSKILYVSRRKATTIYYCTNSLHSCTSYKLTLTLVCSSHICLIMDGLSVENKIQAMYWTCLYASFWEHRLRSIKYYNLNFFYDIKLRNAISTNKNHNGFIR